MIEYGGSWSTIQGRTADQTFRYRAEAQIQAARSGRTLRTTQTETHPSSMWSAPTQVDRAYYRAAYWLAVGARVLLFRGNTAQAGVLVSAAEANNRSGYARSFIELTQSPVKIQQIQQEAADQLASAGLPDIALLLNRGGSYAVQAAERESQRQQSTTGIVADTLRESERDIFKVAEATRNAARQAAEAAGQLVPILTGERPEGTSPTAWWLQQNAFRLGVGLLGVAVLAVVFRPYVQAADRLTPRR
jgi:hypothetical protein